VKRISVAVLLDGTLDDAIVSTVKNSVIAAAGLDTNRGDTIMVANLPFDQSSQAARAKADEEAAKMDMYMGIARGALVVISIIVVLLLVRSLIKGLTRDPMEIKASKALKTKQGQQQLAPATPVVPIKIAPTEEELHRVEVQREIAKLARNEPKLVAQIVKSWLDER